jgi:hypothetical protein
MNEIALQNFYTDGKVENVISMLEDLKDYELAYTLGQHFCRIFPLHSILLELTASAAHATKRYNIAYDLYTQLINRTRGPERAKNFIVQQQAIARHVANDYNFYPRDIVVSLCKRMPIPLPLITFTITSCKRFDLFEQTVNSFLNCCTDVEKIDSWLCVDDNSSNEDREKMQSRYPFFRFYFKTKEACLEENTLEGINREITKLKTRIRDLKRKLKLKSYQEGV